MVTRKIPLSSKEANKHFCSAWEASPFFPGQSDLDITGEVMPWCPSTKTSHRLKHLWSCPESANSSVLVTVVLGEFSTTRWELTVSTVNYIEINQERLRPTITDPGPETKTTVGSIAFLQKNKKLLAVLCLHAHQK